MKSRYQNVICCALAVISGQGEKIVFVHQQRGPFSGSWLLPGGGIEVGEHPEAAVRREIMEETGLQVVHLELFSLYEIVGDWQGGKYHLLMFAFRCECFAAVSEGFRGHNVGDVKQVRVGVLPLHSTHYRILTDAGVVKFEEANILAALKRDNIEMRAYRVIEDGSPPYEPS